jgi:hypothetical protein
VDDGIPREIQLLKPRRTIFMIEHRFDDDGHAVQRIPRKALVIRDSPA